MTVKSYHDWLGLTFVPDPEKVLLFCFPFAGGGSQFYCNWKKKMGPHVQVCPVYLPGRERRIREPLQDHMPTLVNELVDVIAPFTKQRYAFFGHSMGALIAHLLSCALIQAGHRAPQHLFVSARGNISAETMQAKVKAVGIEGYLKSILNISSQTEKVLRNEELRKIFLPIFRADVKLCAQWHEGDIFTLPSPITAFYGEADESVSVESVEAWRQATESSFTKTQLPGEHLFVLQQAERLSNEITRTLACQTVTWKLASAAN